MATTAFPENLHSWVNNFNSNVQGSFSKLSLHDWIRLVTVVGAYCLLRPYLIKLGARFQAQDHERQIDDDETSSGAAISPNTLRGQVQVPEDSDDDDEGVKGATGADWGKKARRRQRRVIRKILEAEEKLSAEQAEADSDKDIEEFLVKS